MKILRISTSPRWVILPLLAILAAPAFANDREGDVRDFDRPISADDRSHWSYQPVEKPRIPIASDQSWTRNPVDSFTLSRLEAKGWSPAAPASPRALLRRVFLDVSGLPPSLAEQDRWLNDDAPDRWERLIDDLLGHPSYGERWGRHWLDLVRYAESNGYERDAAKPHVWRYRDYVIAALNSDKPYDRFVREQLAGDELADRSAETVVATGFHRLGPWDDEPADPEQDRFDQLDDIVGTTSQVFLATTLSCCRCHDHKFDPLSMLDYYRMVAIFDPLHRPQNGRTELDLPAGSDTELAVLEDRDLRIADHEQRIAALRSAFRRAFLETGMSALPSDVLAAFRTEPGQQTAAQQELVKRHSQQLDAEISAAIPSETLQHIAEQEQQIATLRAHSPDLPRGYFLREPSPTPPTSRLLMRGRAATPGPVVQPGLPVVLAEQQPQFAAANAPTTLRRHTLASWISSPTNPLTARVIVNRVWQYHFGEGLVRTPSDFGVLGELPTHPDLLDWLAHWFVHDAGWSLKKLHRLILNSNTYQMSKASHPDYAKQDPENRCLWRFPYRRLEVEAICDSMLAASGQLNREMYGPSTYLFIPEDAFEGNSDRHSVWHPFVESQAARRTVYAFVKRSLVVPMLEVLDLCDTTRSTEQRNITSIAPQALTLFNGEFVNRQAGHLAERLVAEAGDDPNRQVELAYRLALCRRPSDEERAAVREFLENEAMRVSRERSVAGLPATDETARRLALIQTCRVILNLNEFVYPE